MLTHTSRYCASFVSLLVVFLPGCIDPPPSNNTFPRAKPIEFNDSGTVEVTGEIVGDLDPDFYAIGPLAAGDRILVDVDTIDSELDATVIILDEFRNIFRASDDATGDVASVDPFVDDVIRHPSNNYVVAINRTANRSATSGSYTMRITVERGSGPPARPRQTVLLDFDGGQVTTPNGVTVQIPPFDATDIDPIYDGMTDAIKTAVVETFRRRFARFDLEILETGPDAPPSDGRFSTILIGGDGATFQDPSAETFGVTVAGTDVSNRNPADDALVFANTFMPDRFALPPSVQELGTVIGNVAAHEMGHLLGLEHVTFDGLMRFVNLATFLEDLEFERGIIEDAVFPTIPADVAWQDAEQLLRDALGEFPGPIDVVAADLDNDGDIDLATANAVSDNVSILLSDGDGRFVVGQNADVGPDAAALAIGDLDSDGDADLVVLHASVPSVSTVSTGLSVLLNRGDGSFDIATAVRVSFEPSSVALGDIDADGDLDLVAGEATLDGETAVLVNRGDATFEDPLLLASPLAGVFFEKGSTLLVDVDGDDDLDIVMADCADDSTSITVALNTSSGQFQTATTIATGPRPCHVRSADIDNDGDSDLVVARDASFGSSGGVDILLNDGAGLFTTITIADLSRTGGELALGDWDADGDVDVVVVDRRGNDGPGVVVLRNAGDGRTFSQTRYDAGPDPFGVTAGDFDDDGDLDIAVTDADTHQVILLLNDQTGMFTEQISVTIGPT